MLRSALVLAATIMVPVAWAEEERAPEGGAAATTTTTRPERSRYGGNAGEPAGLPTGLPGFGSPGIPPPEGNKDAPKEPAAR